jgi:predicted transcriptional regulator
MAKKYVLIVADGCRSCEEAEKLLGAESQVRILNATKNPYAADIIKQTGIFKAPLLIEIDEENDQVCVLEKNAKVSCIKESGLVRDGRPTDHSLT